MAQGIMVTTSTIILLVTGVLLGYVISQLVLGYLPLTLVTLLGTSSLILIFATVYYILFWQFKRQNLGPLQTQTTSQQQNNSGRESYLKSRLIAMLGGDVVAAQRLFDQAKQNYPGMPENWYWERALAEFERDRH